ncbi:MAG TPA: hypothetical protein VFR69_12010 [Rubrobacteraceae bacterium]|nr:hypothetical protein [Rubrobacteraceae bacterium]
MRGGNLQKPRYLGQRREAAPAPRANLRSVAPSHRTGRRASTLEERRKANKTSVYRRRRIMAVGLFFSFVLALVFAVLLQAPDAAEPTVPIDPGNAAPDTVLAKAAGIDISTPIRPESLTGLGYHPEGESLVEMEPRGENLSANPLVGLLSNGSTAEDIHYHVMDAAGRTGPRTGALDVGAQAGTFVYAPVTGMVTAIRPDPMVQGANVVEIKPDANANIRVTVSLVQSDEANAGVTSRVTAGMTELGTVADSAKVLDPQLSSYTSDAGNHVTVSVARVS